MTRYESPMAADDAQLQDRFVDMLSPEPFTDFDGVPTDLEFFMPMASTSSPACSKSTIEWLSDCCLSEMYSSTSSANPTCVDPRPSSPSRQEFRSTDPPFIWSMSEGRTSCSLSPFGDMLSTASSCGSPLSPLSMLQGLPATNSHHHRKAKRGRQHVHFADLADEENEGESPERGPYLSLLNLGRAHRPSWMPTIHGSILTDSDTDDFSDSLSSSSSSLSPPYQDDAELRNTSDDDDHETDNGLDDCTADALTDDDVSCKEDPHTSRTPTIDDVLSIYHPIEEYPSPHLDTYADDHNDNEQGHQHAQKKEQEQPDDEPPPLALSALFGEEGAQLPFSPLSLPPAEALGHGLESTAEAGHGPAPISSLIFPPSLLRTSPETSPLSMPFSLPPLEEPSTIATIDNVKPAVSDMDADTATFLRSPLLHSATLPLSPPSPPNLPLFHPYRPCSYPASSSSSEYPFGWNNSFSFSGLWEGEAAAPCSPSRRRSTDLPEEDSFGLTSSCPSTTSSLSSADSDFSPLFFDQQDQQRTTWLTLPGADSDDDLIPLALASKNYIPDPTITISTTPSAPLLLFDDPIDGDIALASRRWSSPSDIDEFSVDPKVLEDLTLRGAKEEVEEAKKLVDLQRKTQTRCRLRARARSLGGLGSSFGEYANDGVGRAWDRWEREREAKERERAREVAALLRLKLGLDEKGCCVRAPGSGVGESLDAGAEAEDGSTCEDDALPPRPSTPAPTSALPSKPGARRASSLPIATLTSTASPPVRLAGGLVPSSDNFCSSNSSRSSSASSFSSMFDSVPPSTATSMSSTATSMTSNMTSTSPSPKRCSKSKITSMAQLVASMVFHRQQQADCARRAGRAPPRSRTWAAPSSPSSNAGSSVPSTSSNASTSSGQQEKNVGAKTPRSPLSQMILPDEPAGDDDHENEEGQEELELSPLSLGLLCASPETYLAELANIPGVNAAQV